LGSKPDLSVHGVEHPTIITKPADKFQPSTFKRVYEFAYSAGGLNKTINGAEAFALEQISKG
jgi:hypothetical protein